MLDFEYTMEMAFDAPASAHAFTLRCLPQENATQHVVTYEVCLEPETDLFYGTDGFKNRYCYGCIDNAHQTFRLKINGTVERFAEKHEAVSENEQMLYRHQTEKTEPGPHLKALMESLNLSKEDAQKNPVEAAARIRDAVHGAMTYAPGTTTPATSAEEAAGRGEGVCQDYVHMMLSLCRILGIACRYTAGLIIGEGHSHAWIEVCDGSQWIAMDPTNPDISWDQQVIWSHGRDAVDCEINRGVYRGLGSESQTIHAAVTRQEDV